MTNKILSEDDIRAIRKAYRAGASISSLAKQYCMNAETIRQIVKYQTWRNVE